MWLDDSVCFDKCLMIFSKLDPESDRLRLQYPSLSIPSTSIQQQHHNQKEVSNDNLDSTVNLSKEKEEEMLSSQKSFERVQQTDTYL